MSVRKYVFDTNCFIDAGRDPVAQEAFRRFAEEAAPGLYLSAVVAAELRMGAVHAEARRTLENLVLVPYQRRGRVLTPSARSWEVLGTVLGTLALREGLPVGRTRRSFMFDILVAQSCREAGAVLVSGNTRDMARIAKITPFEWVAPYPHLR